MLFCGEFSNFLIKDANVFGRQSHNRRKGRAVILEEMLQNDTIGFKELFKLEYGMVIAWFLG